MPDALKRLDDKVLGDRFRGQSPQNRSNGSPSEPYPGDKKTGGDTKGAAATAGAKAGAKTDAKADTKAQTKADTKAAPPARPKAKAGSTGGKGAAAGKAASTGLDLVVKIVRAVLLALALIVVLGIVVVLVPTNPENSLVKFVSETANTVAGPFKDVFTFSTPKRSLSANYGLAAVVFIVLASLVTKLRGLVK